MGKPLHLSGGPERFVQLVPKGDVSFPMPEPGLAERAEYRLRPALPGTSLLVEYGAAPFPRTMGLCLRLIERSNVMSRESGQV